MISIRSGKKTDLSDVHRLIIELAVFEKCPDSVKITIDQLEKDFEHGLFGFEVAQFENKTVGMALYYFRYSTWNGKCLFLEDLIVNENHRSAGIGKLLFEEVRNKAISTNCSMMMWQVLDWNTRAIDFYKQFGTVFDNEWYNATIHFK